MDRERVGWRANTVLLLDNASYHNAKETIELMKQLNIPVMFSGPHSYSTSPIELVFAALKSRNLNPEQLPTGKR